ncbi:MAG: hypothetical protein M5U01_07600 [Ardenticatenaceae bacterium]|nr:hypothetical protein [Ardenticatenaceae bacterium]HBY97257.1 hypothetical protein [Chloroflexota bacterium]
MDTTEFLVYWRVIRKRWWLIALLLSVTLAVIGVSKVNEKPLYHSSTRLQVVAAAPGEVSLFEQFRAAASRDEITQAQADFIQTLYSDTVAFTTIAATGLGISPPTLKANISNSTDGAFINVTYAAISPEEAEKVLTTLVDQTLTTYRQLQARPATVTREFLTGELETADQQVSEAREALLKFKQRHNLADLDREILATQDALRSLRSQRDNVQSQSLQAAALVDFYKTQMDAATNSAEEATRREASATATFWLGQARNYGDRLIEQQALAESTQIQLDQLNQQIAAREAELASYIGLQAELADIQERLARAEANFNFLYGKQSEAILKENQALKSGFIQVTNPVRTSDRPFRTSASRLLILGAVVSIVAGLVLAFLLEFIESVVKQAMITSDDEHIHVAAD